MAYANGLIPLSAMRQLSTGGYLLANAAAAFETWRVQAAAAGFDMRPTSNSDAFRSLAVQEILFFARYSLVDYGRRTNGAVKTYRGVTYYLKPGFAVAATPGSSNHGKGLAVDIKNSGGFGGAYHNWMSRTGPALGFNNVEGRSINEPWHWVHSGAFTVSNPVTNGGSVAKPKTPGAPAPIIPVLEEDDDMRGLFEALYRYYMDREGSAAEVDKWTVTAACAGLSLKEAEVAFAKATAEPGTVTAAYREFLVREASPAEVTSWVNQRATVRTVRDAIANSPEAKKRK